MNANIQHMTIDSATATATAVENTPHTVKAETITKIASKALMGIATAADRELSRECEDVGRYDFSNAVEAALKGRAAPVSKESRMAGWVAEFFSVMEQISGVTLEEMRTQDCPMSGGDPEPAIYIVGRRIAAPCKITAISAACRGARISSVHSPAAGVVCGIVDWSEVTMLYVPSASPLTWKGVSSMMEM